MAYFKKKSIQLILLELHKDNVGDKQCDQKKWPNVYKSCPKMISLEKLKILTPLQKLLKNVGDLGKLIVAKGFEKCPKFNKLPNLVTLVTKSKSGMRFRSDVEPLTCTASRARRTSCH